MTSEWKVYGRIFFAVLCLSILIVVYHWAADKFRTPPIIATTQHAATTPEGVQAAAHAAKVPVTDQSHAREISNSVERATERPPDEQIQTTGSEWEKVAEAKRIENKSDFVMVTDPRRPLDRPSIKPGDNVTLNAYFIKAFPKSIQQIGYGPPSTIIASASWKIGKTKNAQWYVGAWGTVDYQRPEQSRAGIMFTRMQ